MGRFRRTAVTAALLVASASFAAAPSHAQTRGGDAVGTSFPPDFPVATDASLGVPVIGFGSEDGNVENTPVVFLHGNNDTPYPTRCNGSYGAMQAFAQHFADHGYSLKELWALGYQGDQCDLVTDQTRRAGAAHATLANVPDLRRFVAAVLAYTGADQVDLVGHSLGATLAREWMRQDGAYDKVRRLVSIDGPHHGIINCSPSPANYYQSIGFVPDSPVCLEYGAADTPFLRSLNGAGETPGPTEYMAIVNADTSFVYYSKQDGVLLPVPAQDRTGAPHDFSRSAWLDGATIVELTGQGIHDKALLAAHTGIAASPDAWKATFDFLTAPGTTGAADPAAPDDPAAPAPSPSTASPSADLPVLPATGASGQLYLAAVLLALSAALLGFRALTSRAVTASRPPVRDGTT